MSNQDSESSANISYYEEDDEEDEDEYEAELKQEFANNVKEYIKLDSKQRDYKKRSSDLEPEKKPLEKSIVEYLDTVDLGFVEVTDGKLIINRTETLSPLTRDIVIQALKDKVGDIQKVAEIIKHIDLIRQQRSKVRTNLKREFKDTKAKNT